MKSSQDQETTLKEGSIFLKHDRKHDRLYNYKLCNIFSSGYITIKYTFNLAFNIACAENNV
jgi:hypothetical protein